MLIYLTKPTFRVILCAPFALAGCTSDPPSLITVPVALASEFGPQPTPESPPAPPIGQGWSDGQKLVQKGEQLVQQGEALVQHGRTMIEQGQRTMREAQPGAAAPK